jgi:hypothetical protein
MRKFIEEEIGLDDTDMGLYNYTADEVEDMDEEELENANIEDADEYIKEYKLAEKRDTLVEEAQLAIQDLISELELALAEVV